MIKRIIKTLRQKIDGFGYKKIIYDYQKTLWKLTVLLFVGVFFVIRGSTFPLLVDIPILHTLFYSEPNADKTLYNIGISIIAAYIFYLLQVYLPSKKINKRKILIFSGYHRHEAFLLNQYILAWEQFLKKDGECNFFEFKYKIKNGRSYFLTKDIYAETVDGLIDNLDKIIENPIFFDLDLQYKDFIINSKWTIYAHLKFMYDQFPLWYDKPLEASDSGFIKDTVIKEMKQIQDRLMSIEKKYIEVESVQPCEFKPLFKL